MTEEKGKLVFVGDEEHKTGTTTELLKEAKTYAAKGWTVLYVSPEAEKKVKEAEAEIESLTVKDVKPADGKARRIIELCKKEKADLLLVDDLQLGVNDLQQLSAAAKELDLLIKVGRPKTRPTGEVPLKGSST